MNTCVMWRHATCITLFFLHIVIFFSFPVSYHTRVVFFTFFTLRFFFLLFFKMSPEDFFEQMKIVFSQWEGAETTNTSNTSNTPQNIIAKPRKNYINVHDILSTFNINKDVYNNLLVRTVINGQ